MFNEYFLFSLSNFANLSKFLMLSIETCLKYSTSVVEFLNLLVPSQKKFIVLNMFNISQFYFVKSFAEQFVNL